MASLLYYMGGIARWFIILGTFDIMCMARALTKGPTPTHLVAGPAGLGLRERGNRAERFMGALTMTGPWTSYCRETTKNYQVSKC